jgi:Uma2 family endonuclease
MIDSPVETKRMTVDEFLAWLATQPDGTRYELHHGEPVEMSPSKAVQTVIAARLIAIIGAFAEGNSLGVVTSSDGGFYLSRDDFYAPDVSFYSRARLPQGIPQDDYFRVAPDLAVEVVSASDESSVHRKAQRYLEIGVQMVWVVYPKQKLIDVYTPSNGGALVRQAKLDDVLDGGELLVGFSVPVARVFGEKTSEAQ